MECRDRGRRNGVIVNTSRLETPGTAEHGAVITVKDVSRMEELERRLGERRGQARLVGGSEAMQAVYGLIDRLREVDTTVLILGESGTGKELVAESIHSGGVRAGGPLVKVNCAALSESLLESELFGHVKGAFTGAQADKEGRFQAAEGGVVFLDEIGDISPRIQLKLLRFLDSKEFERVGESTTRRADVQVMAATNADLEARVRSGDFRDDLYSRLKVMVVRTPALRERLDDVPLLAEHFLEDFAARFHTRITGVGPEALALLMRHGWPGNVRELRHAMEHAAILCPGGPVLPEHLPGELTRNHSPGAASRPSLQPEPRHDPDRDEVARALRQTGGNKAQAARLLGIGRRSLYRRIEKYGL